MTPTPEQLAEWTNSAQKVWDSQGRMHWVNMDQFDNYVAGYLRCKTELLDQPEPPQNKEKLDDLLGQYWDIAHSEGSTGVSRGDEAGAVLSAIKSLLDQQKGEPVAWVNGEPVASIEAIIRAQAARIDELEAQLAAVQKDAGRYQWLRSRKAGGDYRINGIIYSDGDAVFDAQIDAAIAGEATNE